MGTSSVVRYLEDYTRERLPAYADATTSCAEFPRSGGLAKGACIRIGGLSIDGVVSRAGEVWTVPPTAPRRCFHSSQHRRGLWQTKSGRESSVLEHCGRFLRGELLLPDPHP